MDFSPHYIISLRSVIIDSIPEEEGVERNESKTSGFIITPTGPKCSKVTFFNQMSSTTATHYATEIIGASRVFYFIFILFYFILFYFILFYFYFYCNSLFLTNILKKNRCFNKHFFQFEKKFFLIQEKL